VYKPTVHAHSENKNTFVRRHHKVVRNGTINPNLEILITTFEKNYNKHTFQK